MFSAEGTLECIRSFTKLQKLRVQCRIDNPDTKPGVPERHRDLIQTLHRILSSIPSSQNPGDACAPLHTLKILFTPTIYNTNDDSGRHYVDRLGLLNLLCGTQVLGTLVRFPTLHRLYLWLWDNDGVHDSAWWKDEIVERLPESLHQVISVEVSSQYCMCSFFAWQRIHTRGTHHIPLLIIAWIYERPVWQADTEFYQKY